MLDKLAKNVSQDQVELKLATITPGKPEVFQSKQGEGASAGHECVFVRLSQCNLHCVWCDTPYTWNFKGTNHTHPSVKFDRAAEVMVKSVPDLVQMVLEFDTRRVVITGGEPLLQQRAIIALCKQLKNEDPRYKIEIETNGTISPGDDLSTLIDQFNVSPKLEHSNNALEVRRRERPLRWFAKNSNAFFKFVMQSPEDIAEGVEIVDEYSLVRSRVFLMPEGTCSEKLEAKKEWLTKLCKVHGFRFSDRLHIHEYGDTRGT